MTTDWKRSERGEGAIGVLMGAAIGAMVIAAFMTFWYSANQSSEVNTERAAQESAAVAILNRAGSDISDASAIAKNGTNDLVVEQRKVTGSGASKVTTFTRIRYSVVTQDGKKVLQREIDISTDPVYSDATFTPDSAPIVLGRDITDDTEFAYVQADGSPAVKAADVGRVDITYAARTKEGVVTLKSSAALDTALGGTGSTGVTPVSPPPPASVNVTPAAVTFNDQCDTASDTYTVPSTTGVKYQIAGVTKPAGPYPGAGTVSVTAVADPGYTLTGPTTWSQTFTNVSCAPPVGGNVTPAAVTFDDACATTNDTYTIPSTTGVTYQIAGVTKSAGPYAGSGTVTVNAVAQAGYTLTGTTSWSQTYTNVSCGGASVNAYPSAAPTTVAQTTNNNTITWSGGALNFTRVSGTSGAASGALSAASSGTITHNVPLGTVYRYTAGAASDTATQFPPTPTTKAEGSDWNRDDTADHVGSNAVDWTVDVAGTTTYTQVRAYVSKVDLANRGTLGTFSTIENPSQSTTTCPSTANANGNCYLAAGAAAGTEKVYAAIAYTDCDFQGAKVTVGGVARCPSANYYTLGVNPLSDYTSSVAQRAYQAPSVVAQSVTGGNASGDNCMALDENGTSVRLVNDFPDTATNGIYSCADGSATIAYTSDPDHGNPADGQFCDYAGAAADCHGKAVRGSTTYDGPLGAGSATVSIAQSAWARTDDYSVYACNLGGCSTPAATTLKSFSGPFSINDASQPPTKRMYHYNHWFKGSDPTCWDSAYNVSNCAKVHQDEIKIGWTVSTGGQGSGGSYRLDGGYVAGPGNSSKTWSGLNTGTTENSGYLSGIDAATVYKFSVRMVPGNDVNMWRRSTGGNGRYWDYVYTAPMPISFVQDSGFCKPGFASNWKYGIWFRRNAYDWSGTRRNALGLNFRYMWWATRAWSSADPNSAGEWASSKWRAGDNTSWPSSWTSDETTANNGTPVYNNFAGDATDGAWVQILTGGGSQANFIPGDGGTHAGMAHFRIETYTYKSWIQSNLNLKQGVDHGDMTYWVGTGGDDSGTVDSGASLQSADIRTRGVNISSASNTACDAGGKANYAFNSSFPDWYTSAGGYAVTRRAAIGGESSAALGPNTNPNPDKSNGALWKQVN